MATDADTASDADERPRDAPADGRAQGVKSADRTLDVLELLSSTDTLLTLSDMSRRLNAPKSSLHKLLATMTRRGWVEVQDSGHPLYRIGLRALLAGTRYVDVDQVVRFVNPILTTLTDELQEASHLGRLDGADVVYLAKRESPQPLRMYSAVGRRIPAHASAMGKALLAQLDWEVVDELLPRQLRPLTDATITDRPRLRKELDLVRSRGYATDDEESAELMRAVAIALPIAGNAISVSAPTLRLPTERVPDVARLLHTLGDALPVTKG
ncbi:IclR family transcriptional regulator [Humibacter soli]